MRKIFILFFSIVICFSIKAETTPATSYAGSGTSEDPYQIATLAQLRLLSESSDDWDKSFILTADINADDTKNWNSGSGFSPIGNNSTKFTGQFDGQDYTISNLYISRSSEDFVGFIGAAKSDTIMNLILTSVDINGSAYVGGLVGYNEGFCAYCSSTGSIEGSTRVGGLFGGSPGTVENCYSEAQVTGANWVGGFCGYLNGKASNCFSSGNVTADNNGGGFAGIISSTTISNCFSIGKVTDETPDAGYCGCFVGNNSGIIRYCYAGNTGIATNIGCFIGINQSTATLTNCYYLYIGSSYSGIISNKSSQTVNSITETNLGLESSYSNWDFDDIWIIGKVSSYGSYTRPYLKSLVTYYDLTFYAGENGTIDGDTAQCVIEDNSSATITAIPNIGYYFTGWQNTDGTQYSTNASLSISNVSSDITLTAVFEPYTYNITFSSGNNGSITGETSQTIEHGDSATAVTADPNTGYHFDEWRNTDGDFITTDNPLTVKNVSQDSSLVAIFEVDTLNVEFSVTNGTITSGDASQEVTYYSNAIPVGVAANTGYYFDEWQNADGDSISVDNPLTVEKVTQDTALIAVFIPYSYSVTLTSDENCSLSGDTVQTIAYNTSASTVTANATTGGYAFVEWQDENGDVVSTENPLTLTKITQDYSLKAIFTKKYEDGLGSSESPYLIASLEQLKNLSESNGDWFRSFIQTANIDAADTKNWNISGTDTLGFSPIGNATTWFKGTFDGQNHTISNLFINTTIERVGIFGGLYGGIIKNLGLVDCDITGGDHVGSLAGTIGKSSIVSNCYASGSVSGASYVGGFMGNNGNSTVSNCFSNVTVTGSGSVISGFIGQTGNSSTVSYCYSAGSVSEGTKTGGFIANESNGGTTISCYFDSETSGKTDSYATALTTTEFADVSKFSNWDFTSTWKIATITSIDSNKRPYFQWMESDGGSSGITSHSYEAMDIYPNPTTGLINVILPDDEVITKLSVYNITGNLVYSNSAFNGDAIDLSTLSNGVYFVKINSGGKTSTVKLIKK